MHNKQIHRTKTNTKDMTHTDYPVPITNLSLSKIGDSGEVQLLWQKITNSVPDIQNISW